MATLNVFAPEWTPAVPVYNNGIASCVLLGLEPKRFDRREIADEDLFLVGSYSPQEFDELRACEEFNNELERLEELEKAEELHQLLQERLRGVQRKSFSRPVVVSSLEQLIEGTKRHPDHVEEKRSKGRKGRDTNAAITRCKSMHMAGPARTKFRPILQPLAVGGAR